MKKPFIFPALLALGTLAAAEIAGVPRDSNFNNTGGYDSTRVEARFNLDIGKDTRAIHFIRDNNDPRVITKTYVLQNVDPYEFRDYLRQMVQSKRVGNTTLQQSTPGNTTAKPWIATTSAPTLNTPTAQSGYSPQTQLGSNTAVECLKYADGTGLLFVSAEEYRFRDNENGLGIDTLVRMLDDPGLGDLNYGTQMFLYMPKFVPARNLLPLIQNVGMNISDVTELWQGQDLVALDPELNWLAFDVCNYSCTNVAAMLAKFDVPIPQVRLKIRVYEFTDENDTKIGMDFQSWKNNEGTRFFSAGGRYRNNWDAIYSSNPLAQHWGSERTSFYNFNPKWNTRYIDFLASRGKAKLLHTGELCLRNATSGTLSRTTGIFYMNDSGQVPGAVTPGGGNPDYGVGTYQLLADMVAKALDSKGTPIAVGKGHTQKSELFGTSFGFTMKVLDTSVNLHETRFKIELSNTSLLGFQSDGTPRISQGSTVSQEVSLPHGQDTFVIGGLRKQEKVTSKTGVPLLKDIPYLEYLFSTVSTTVRHSELIVVGQCISEIREENPWPGITKREVKGKRVRKSVQGGN